MPLLSASYSLNEEDLWDMSIGQRDSRLIQLRNQLFGSRVSLTALCPLCNQRVEWENDLKAVLLPSAFSGEPKKDFELDQDGFRIRFRLPTCHDIRKLNPQRPPEKNSQQLISQCLLRAFKNESECELADLPESIVDAMEQRISEEDSQADIRFLLNCPSCFHKWESRFDIVSFLWAEINSWAVHLVREVYILAKSFGWAEQDILHMSTQRRQMYIEMSLS
jgi:hypothetical protein